MKKTILVLMLVIGLFTSFSVVKASTVLSEKKIVAIVQMLRAFDVDESKITDIVKILRKDNPVIKKQAPVQQKIINNCKTDHFFSLVCSSA